MEKWDLPTKAVGIHQALACCGPDKTPAIARRIQKPHANDPKERVDATFQSPQESWNQLRKTVESYDIALFLGAGVSTPNVLPSWKDFIGHLGGWSEDEVAVCMADGMSLISLCEVARSQTTSAKWKESVRHALYEGFRAQVNEHARKIAGLSIADFDSKDGARRKRVSRFFKATNPVLWEIVRVCGVGASKHPRKNDRIGALLSTNLDALPQLCDRAVHGARILRTVERASTEPHAEKIPLYQLHGYILPPRERPITRGEAADALVLTESDYVARTDGPYAWANVTLHWAVREFPVVFIGCSMTDDLIRRALLRSCRERSEDYSAKKSVEAAEITQRRHFAVRRLHREDRVNRLWNQSAAVLGLWPLWVENYDKDLALRVRTAVNYG
jgi:hypothetical protein